MNHFAKACLSIKKVNQMETIDNKTKLQDYDYDFFIGILDENTNENNDKWEMISLWKKRN